MSGPFSYTQSYQHPVSVAPVYTMPGQPVSVIPLYTMPSQAQPAFSYTQPQQPHFPVYPMPSPGQPSIPSLVHKKTLELLAKANEQVDIILDRKIIPHVITPCCPAVVPQQPVLRPAVAPFLNVDLSDRSVRIFSKETHVHNDGDKSKKEEKDNTGLRILVGVIGLAVALWTAFSVGKEIAKQEDAQEKTEDYETLKSTWDTNRSYYNNAYVINVDKVVNRMDAINARNATNRTHKMALLALTFAAGGAAFAGALVASNLLMGAAAVMGACAGVFALYKLGYACFNTREHKDANAIEKTLYTLEGMQSN